MGVSRVILEPIVWTMRQPPNERAQRHRGLAGQDHPERHVEVAAEHALRVEQDGDDAHRLLGVVAAMAEANRARPRRTAGVRKVLSTAKGVARTKTQDTISTSTQRQDEADGRRQHDRGSGLAHARSRRSRSGPPWPRRRPTSPPISACELLRRNAGHPGDDVPRRWRPISAPKITAVVDDVRRRRCPCRRVWATCRPKNRKAMKLKKAAQNTA